MYSIQCRITHFLHRSAGVLNQINVQLQFVFIKSYRPASGIARYARQCAGKNLVGLVVDEGILIVPAYKPIDSLRELRNPRGAE